MSDLYGVPQGAGLMSLFANPQTAGLLGMAGGLLQASGPSRIPVSMGQAMGAGLQGMGQSAAEALNTQRQMLQMQAVQRLNGLLGSDASAPGNAAPAIGQQPAVAGAPNVGPMSGLSAGMGAYAPMPSSAASSAASAYPTQTSGPVLFDGRTPAQIRQIGMAASMAGLPVGAELMKLGAQYDPTLSLQMPTDTQKMAAAAYGYGTPEYTNAIRGVVDKEGIVALRPGAPYIRGGQVYGTPGQAPAGYMNVPNGDGTWSVQPVSGGPEAVKGSAAAGAIGKAYGSNTTGYSGGKPVYVNQGVLSDQLTGGGPGSAVPGFSPFQNAIRQVESGGNPAAVNPASGASGSMQTMAATLTNPGFGVTPARDNSPAEKQRVGADYATAMQQKYGNDTDAAVAYNWGPQNADKWIAAGRPWKMLPAETQGFVGQVHAQMQNFAGGTPATNVAPELPPGAQAAANSAQGAPSKQMADAQDALASQDANYQQSRGALLKMLSIAQSGGLGDTMARMLPQDVATRLSNDAAEYQKAHANYVSLQGKALGSGGTDASRAMLDEAVPTFDKPQDAKISGLSDQLNQLDLAHLKRQTLSPVYQQGAEKAYTDLSAQFDKTVTPQMMPKLLPIISAPPSPARTQALQQAVQDPQMKAALDLMVRTGQLK